MKKPIVEPMKKRAVIEFILMMITGVGFMLTYRYASPSTDFEKLLYAFTLTSCILSFLVNGLGVFIYLIHTLSTNEESNHQVNGDCELTHSVVKVNYYYHLMLNEDGGNSEYKDLYLKAVTEFQNKAAMYDAIFGTKTVLVYAKDHEEGKVIEITFESRPL